MKFTTEEEVTDTLPFLDILVIKRGPKLAMKVYRKPTHAGHHLHFKSTYPHHMIRRVFHSLISRAKVMCQDQKDIKKLRTQGMI
jgi:hypothetical protein